MNGIYGIDAGGFLWHFQDNGGWTDTGGRRVAQVAVTHGPSGNKETFALTTDHEVWELVGNGWRKTNRSL